MLCCNIVIINKGIIVENISMKVLLFKLSLEIFVLDIKILDGVLNMDNLLMGFEYCLIDDYIFEVDVEKMEGLNLVFI